MKLKKVAALLLTGALAAVVSTSAFAAESIRPMGAAGVTRDGAIVYAQSTVYLNQKESDTLQEKIEELGGEMVGSMMLMLSENGNTRDRGSLGEELTVLIASGYKNIAGTEPLPDWAAAASRPQFDPEHTYKILCYDRKDWTVADATFVTPDDFLTFEDGKRPFFFYHVRRWGDPETYAYYQENSGLTFETSALCSIFIIDLGEEDEEEPEIVPGDLSGDGELTISDMVMLARWIAGDPDIGGADQSIADVNGDGKVNIMDLAYLCKLVAGWQP